MPAVFGRLTLFLGGKREALARGLHRLSVQQLRALGETAETKPYLVEWDHLPKPLRKSIRAKASATLRQLAALGYTLVPSAGPEAGHFRFSEAEVARLAKMEHARTVAERLGDGWRFSPGPLDANRKSSPTLVPWEQLPGDERTRVCDAASGLPAALASAGFEIVPKAQQGLLASLRGRRRARARSAPG
ncbi:MAG TPA: hypothetical protein PKO09_11595 [Anaerolineae bacterium]|nr:hypothetical protein [Anaerolineae bacterium]